MPDGFKGHDVFNHIVTDAVDRKWDTLPTGQVIANVAHLLDATPRPDLL